VVAVTPPCYPAWKLFPALTFVERPRLIREFHNHHATNAITVWFKNDMLGYVPRRENRTLARMMDRREGETGGPNNLAAGGS